MRVLFLMIMCIWTTKTVNAQVTNNAICQYAVLLTKDTKISDTLKFSTLSESINCSQNWPQTVRAKWFKYVGDGNIINFSLVNRFLYTNQLFVYEGNCDTLICKNFSYDESVKFVTEKDVDYYFVVQKPNPQDVNDAPFTIDFSSAPLKNYASCYLAPTLVCSDSLTFDFGKDLVPSYLSTCQTYGAVGYFRIAGDGNKRIFNFSGANLNGYYLLFTEKDDCNNPKCSGIRYLEPSITYNTEIGKSYLVLLVKYDNYGNTMINLNITCASDGEASTCLTATKIECNENYTTVTNPNSAPEIGATGLISYWYKFAGDDSQKILKFTPSANQNTAYVRVLSTIAGCDELEVVMEGTPISFLNDMVINAFDNTEYYIQILHQGYDGITFGVNCNNLIDKHIDCASAIDLACDTTFQLYKNSRNYEQQCNPNQVSGHWFKLQGNGNIYELSIQLQEDVSEYEYAKMSIFKGDCDSLSCVMNRSLSRFELFKNKIVLKVPDGDDFYIRFTYTNGFNTALLTSTCRNEKATFNPVCTDADTLSCGDIVTPGNRIYGIDLSDQCQEYVGIWYKILGDDNIINIPQFFYYDTRYSIYIGDCDHLTCIQNDVAGQEGLKFYAAKDSAYIIKISVPYKDDFSPNQIIQCQDASENVKPQNALALDCNTQDLILNFKYTGLDFNTKADCMPNMPGFWYFFEGNGQVLNFEALVERDLFMTSFTGSWDSLICGVGANKKLKIQTVVGQKYYFYFSSPFSEVETLKIHCTDVVTNDSFEEASEIFCNTDYIADFSATAYDTSTIYYPPRTSVWFKIKGQNQPILFTKIDSLPLYYQYEVYVEGLDSNIISQNHDVLLFYDPNSLYKFEFFGRQDVTYYIRLITDDNERHIFRATCRVASVADICETAIPVSCGVKYVYDSKDHTADYFNGQIIDNGIWFKFEGNDQHVKIALNGSILNSALFETDTDCSSLKRVGGFYAKLGKTYYLNVGSLGQSNNFNIIELQLECKDASINATQCIDAKLIQCGDQFITHNFKVQESPFGDCSFEAYEYGDWFTFMGNGSTWTFFKKSLGSQISSPLVFIGKGTCDSLICLQGFGTTTYQSSGEARTSFSFDTESGVQYFLKFAPQNGEIFEYEYGVECFDEFNNYSCATAQKVACGERVIGALSNTGMDTTNVCNDLRPGLYYEIIGNGSDFALELTNKINNSLYVKIMENDCINGRCLYDGLVYADGKAIVFRTINNRKYLIKISSVENEAVFSFKTACLTRKENIDCNSTEFITCGDNIDITCYTPLGFEGNIPCQWNKNSAFWYILPKTDSLFSLELLSKTSNFYNVELVKGSCNEIQCLGSFTERSNNISFKVNKTEDNYLVIHAPYDVINTLKFNLKCELPKENQNCQGAKIINCGDKISSSTSLSNFATLCGFYGKSLWYKFDGQDEKVTFDFTDLDQSTFIWIVEDRSCDTIICSPTKYINQSGKINFVAENGKKYFLIIHHQNYIGGSFDVEMSCTDAVVNDLCKGAIELSNNISIDLSNSTGHQFTNLQGCQQETENGLWYFVKGNDSIQIISTPIEFGANLYYQLISGSCNQFSCIESGQIYDRNSIKFLSTVGENYYIYFYTNSFWNNGPFSIFINTVAQPINDLCNGSIFLTCGDKVHLDFANFTKDRILHCYSDFESAWYYIQPTETNQFDFRCDFPKNSFIVEIFENCTSSCLYQSYINRDVENTFSFVAMQDKTYHIKISPSQLDTFDLDFQINCTPFVYKNITHTTAEKVGCKIYTIDAKDLPINLNAECIESKKQLWYNFVGDGTSFMLDADFNGRVSYYIIDTNCQQLQFLYFGNNYFQTTEGVPYFLAVLINDATLNDNFSFEIQYQCIDNAEDVILVNDRLKITPNPYFQKTIVNVFSKSSETSTLKIVNTDGHVIVERSVQLSPGINSIEIGEHEVSGKGVFRVLLQTKDVIRSGTMIKVD